MRVDKTLSELWHLRGNTDEFPQTYEEFKEEASQTALAAINAIKRLQEANERYEQALQQIIKIDDHDISSGFEMKEIALHTLGKER